MNSSNPLELAPAGASTRLITTAVLAVSPDQYSHAETAAPNVRDGENPHAAECGHPLPPVEMTLPLGESVHRALIRKAARGKRIDCPELTGQNQWGHPMVGPHQHAHVFPIDVDDDGWIDHVIIHASMGFSPTAIDAIGSLHTLYGPAGRTWLNLHVVQYFALGGTVSERTGGVEPSSPHPCRLVPHTIADVDRLTDRMLGGRAGTGCAVWTSLTPYVAPRFMKRAGKNTLEGQIRAELVSRGFPEAEVTVRSLPPGIYRGYVLERGANHSPPPQRCGHAVYLRFPCPVSGPIALGYASHFGLGLFYCG